jgi:hypothetical protein
VASRKTHRANSFGFTVVLPIDLSVSHASLNAVSKTASVCGSKEFVVEPDHDAILATGGPRTPIKLGISGIRMSQFCPAAGVVAATVLTIVPCLFCYGMRTRGDMLSFAIAFALRGARKLVRGLRQELTEEERHRVADDVVDRLKQHGDPWRLSEELPPPGKGHSTQ